MAEYVPFHGVALCIRLSDYSCRGCGDSHVPSDRSNIHDNPAPPLGHVWDNKLRKPHRGEEICFKRIPGGIRVHIQDRACSAVSLLSPLSRSQEGSPGHITPALLTSTSMRPLSLSTILTTLFRLSSSVTSRTIYQKRSELPSWDSQLRRSHPFDLFVRKTIHRLISSCSRVDLVSRGGEFLASSRLCQR